MSIVVQKVIKKYGSQKALDTISLSIKSGEIVAFLGPNGAGKSTMMKIITGYIPPTSGKVEVCGIDVAEDPLSVKKNIGYLPESNPLYYDMYIKEYLKFVAKIYKLDNAKERVEDVIKKVGITKEQHKKIGQLSKGYKQRVGIAQALIHDPEVLILDEPTTGLDPNQLEEIRELIFSIAKDKTILLSTHIMQEVEAICDRVIIIKDGKIVANKAADLIRKEQGLVLSVLFKEKVDRKKLEKLPGILHVKEEKGNTYLIGIKDENSRGAIFDFAVQEGYTILGLEMVKKSMEEVFKTLTKNT